MGDDEDRTIGGVPASEIPVPRTRPIFCVGCEDEREFDLDRVSGSSLVFGCLSCDHEIEPDLNP